MKNPVLIIIAVFCILVAIVAALDYFVLHQFFAAPPATEQSAPSAASVAPPVAEQPTPSAASIAPTEKAAPAQPPITQPPKSLEQSIADLTDAITDAAASGESQEIIMIISEAEANATAAEMLTLVEVPGDIPLEIISVSVDFKPGNIVLTTIETNIQVVLSFNIDVEVTSQVDVTDGKPAVAITDINFTGSALLPQSLKDQITGYFTQQIEDVLTQVTEVDVGGGEKVILEYKDINIQEDEATVTVVASPT